IAQIDTGAVITGGLVEVFSESMETVLGGAGDITTGHGVGIGVSVLVSDINRTTSAVLGAVDLSAPGNNGTNIDVTGGVTVEAENDGGFGASAVAGPSVTPQPKAEAASPGSKDDPVDEDAPLDGVSLPMLFGDTPQDKPQAKTGAAIAGAAAV